MLACLGSMVRLNTGLSDQVSVTSQDGGQCWVVMFILEMRGVFQVSGTQGLAELASPSDTPLS